MKRQQQQQQQQKRQRQNNKMLYDKIWFSTHSINSTMPRANENLFSKWMLSFDDNYAQLMAVKVAVEKNKKKKK